MMLRPSSNEAVPPIPFRRRCGLMSALDPVRDKVRNAWTWARPGAASRTESQRCHDRFGLWLSFGPGRSWCEPPCRQRVAARRDKRRTGFEARRTVRPLAEPRNQASRLVVRIRSCRRRSTSRTTFEPHGPLRADSVCRSRLVELGAAPGRLFRPTCACRTVQGGSSGVVGCCAVRCSSVALAAQKGVRPRSEPNFLLLVALGRGNIRT